jgi:hypothetical protein
MLNFSSRALLALFIFVCVTSAYGQTKVVVIPLFGDGAPAPIEYAIGDTGPAGGKVFYITHGGLHGLEAAPVDQAEAPWNCAGTDVVGVDNIEYVATPDVRSGAANTALIAAACGGAAAVAADYVWPNGQTDGFLPNKEELNLLCTQRNVVGGFASNFYWSSSQASAGLAWYQHIGGGDQYDDFKYYISSVRAVRAF